MITYTTISAKTMDEFNFQIEFNKIYQLEKFKNGIQTINWNNKEIIIDNNIFVDINNLNEYALSNFKTNTLLCLKLYEFKEYKETSQSSIDLYDSITSLTKDINEDFYKDLIERTKSQKSSTKSCPNCKSIIKIEKINSHTCPVCLDNEFLFTDTDKKSFESKSLRLDKLNEKFNEKNNKYIERSLKKIEKYLNNELTEEEMIEISFKWIVISNEHSIDEADIYLTNLKINSYNILKSIEDNLNNTDEEIKIEENIDKIIEEEIN